MCVETQISHSFSPEWSANRSPLVRSLSSTLSPVAVLQTLLLPISQQSHCPRLGFGPFVSLLFWLPQTELCFQRIIKLGLLKTFSQLGNIMKVLPVLTHWFQVPICRRISSGRCGAILVFILKYASWQTLSCGLNLLSQSNEHMEL